MAKKSKQKFTYLENEESFNKKHFSSFLKGYRSSKDKKYFLEVEGPTLNFEFF